MDQGLELKLRQLDLLEILPSGVKGVRVSLQYKPRIPFASIRQRRASLEQRFRQIAGELSKEGGKVHMDSLSVSGQTLEAILPLDHFDEIERKFSQEDIRVDVLFDQQAAS